MYKAVSIDDEALFLEGFRCMIDWESYGFELWTFQDPSAALRFIRENHVDLVISDIMMPDIDGIELLRQLRSIEPDAITMLLSGASDFEYARSAIRYGVSGYLLKPVNTDELALFLIESKEKLDERYQGIASVGSSEGYYKEIVESMKKNILINYRTVTLEDIAIETKMSTNYVSKIFKKVTGQTFSEYLLEVKMRNAMRLLSSNDLKIYEIAYMIGYDNPKNFTRAFRKYYGKSPWEQRENGSRE